MVYQWLTAKEAHLDKTLKNERKLDFRNATVLRLLEISPSRTEL